MDWTKLTLIFLSLTTAGLIWLTYQIKGRLDELYKIGGDQLMDALPSMMLATDSNGSIIYSNKRVSDEIGIDTKNLLGLSIFDIFPNIGISKDLIEQVIRLQENQKIEGVHREKFNKEQYFDLTLSPISYCPQKIPLFKWLNNKLINSNLGCLIRVDDTTDQVLLENLMIQNEKMLSIGELAAGMAHEINNPLSTILQGIQNIFRRCSIDVKRNHLVAKDSGATLTEVNNYLKKREITKFLQAIQEAGEQAVSIVKNLLEFSRKAPQIKQKVDLKALVENCIVLLESNSETKASIDLHAIRFNTTTSDNLPLIECNKNEIQQVILNMLKNSVHAIEEKFALHKNSLAFKSESANIGIQISLENQLYSIKISDNGIGMSNYTVNRLFDPFFTTKQPGKGTGLGLAVSYFIVTNHHGGSVDVVSKKQEGTAIQIKLPVNATHKNEKFSLVSEKTKNRSPNKAEPTSLDRA